MTPATAKRTTTFTGRVVSHAMTKTLVVAVERTRRHPKYHKLMRVTTKFHVHDPRSAYHTGDVVEFVGCRPISRTKRWIVRYPVVSGQSSVISGRS